MERAHVIIDQMIALDPDDVAYVAVSKRPKAAE